MNKTSSFFTRILFLASLALTGCSGARPAAGPTAPAPGTVLWTFQTGQAVWSSPTVSNGVVYFGSDDQNLYAVDVQTHQLRWKFAAAGIIRARPAVADGVVYISSDDGTLYALDAAAGAEKWHADLGSAKSVVRAELGSGYDYQQSSPIVVDGVVYVGSGAAEVDAFEAAGGRRIWQFATASRVRSTPALADGRLFIGDGSGSLHALDAKTGAELWNAPGCDIPTPYVSNGLVYCGGRGTFEVHAWDVATGELRWKFPVGHSWVDSSPTVSDGVLYIGSSDASMLFAVDAVSGELKWKYPVLGYAWCSPAVADGTVYIGSYSMGVDKDFYAVDAGTGQLKWSVPIKNGVVSSPTVADGVVYFGGMDGSLYAVQG